MNTAASTTAFDRRRGLDLMVPATSCRSDVDVRGTRRWRSDEGWCAQLRPDVAGDRPARPVGGGLDRGRGLGRRVHTTPAVGVHDPAAAGAVRFGAGDEIGAAPVPRAAASGATEAVRPPVAVDTKPASPGAATHRAGRCPSLASTPVPRAGNGAEADGEGMQPAVAVEHVPAGATGVRARSPRAMSHPGQLAARRRGRRATEGVQPAEAVEHVARARLPGSSTTSRAMSHPGHEGPPAGSRRQGCRGGGERMQAAAAVEHVAGAVGAHDDPPGDVPARPARGRRSQVARRRTRAARRSRRARSHAAAGRSSMSRRLTPPAALVDARRARRTGRPRRRPPPCSRSCRRPAPAAATVGRGHAVTAAGQPARAERVQHAAVVDHIAAPVAGQEAACRSRAARASAVAVTTAGAPPNGCTPPSARQDVTGPAVGGQRQSPRHVVAGGVEVEAETGVRRRRRARRRSRRAGNRSAVAPNCEVARDVPTGPAGDAGDRGRAVERVDAAEAVEHVAGAVPRGPERERAAMSPPNTGPPVAAGAPPKGTSTPLSASV